MIGQWLDILTIWDYALLSALLLLFIYQVYFYARYIAAVPRAIRKANKRQKITQTQQDTTIPQENASFVSGVSIIVCARNEERNLRDYLLFLLNQDYPEFEIIVVNDESQDGTRESVEWYMVRDRRVRMTFVPFNAKVGSSKKLALTLGAKSAKYDILLLTDADCRPATTHWISSMVSPFQDPATEVVVGYGAYFVSDSALNRLIQYDTLFNGLHYLGAALTHRPYMGVGRNLAYRKDLFFSSGGFSSLMMVQAGDDDLFVNRVATRHNTTAVYAPESFTWSLPKTTWEDWFQQKRRHLGVSTYYNSHTKMRLGTEPMVRGLFYALLLASIVLFVLGYINLYCVLVALLLFVVRLIMQQLIINSATKRLYGRRLPLCTLYYDIILPLISLYIFFSAPFRRKKRIW